MPQEIADRHDLCPVFEEIRGKGMRRLWQLAGIPAALAFRSIFF